MAPKKPAATVASKTRPKRPPADPAPADESRAKPKPRTPRAGTGQFVPGKSGNPAGRPRGIQSKLTMAIAEERAKIADEAGCTPLQFLVSVYLDADQEMELRERAAKDAAVYFHRRMPAVVEVAGQLGKQLDISSIAALSPEDRKVFLTLIERMGVSL